MNLTVTLARVTLLTVGPLVIRPVSPLKLNVIVGISTNDLEKVPTLVQDWLPPEVILNDPVCSITSYKASSIWDSNFEILSSNVDISPILSKSLLN